MGKGDVNKVGPWGEKNVHHWEDEVGPEVVVDLSDPPSKAGRVTEPGLKVVPNTLSDHYHLVAVRIIIIFNTCSSPRRRGRILPGQSEDCWSCFWSCAWRSWGLTFSSWILYFRFFGDFSNIRKDGRRVLFWEYIASSGFQSLIQFQNEDMEDAILYGSFTEKFLHCDSTWNQTNIFTSKLHLNDTNNLVRQILKV